MGENRESTKRCRDCVLQKRNLKAQRRVGLFRLRLRLFHQRQLLPRKVQMESLSPVPQAPPSLCKKLRDDNRRCIFFPRRHNLEVPQALRAGDAPTPPRQSSAKQPRIAWNRKRGAAKKYDFRREKKQRQVKAARQSEIDAAVERCSSQARQGNMRKRRAAIR